MVAAPDRGRFCTPKDPFQPMNQRGFTIIELAVVIAITGVILVMAAGFALPLMQTAKRIETEEKIDKVSRALAFYAIRNNRLPCPGAPDNGAANPPFGYERGSGANGTAIPANCGAAAANWEGIVPFATIGLTAGDVTDGYGNPFTYAVSPAFAQNTADENLDVHPRCRTREWFYQDGEDPDDLLPKNAAKARYCCPGEDNFAPATDIIVRDAANNSVLSFVREADEADNPLPNPSRSMTGNSYDDADQPFAIAPNVFVSLSDRPVAVNYVLVSHGENGRGAYVFNGGGRRPGVAGTLEAENHDGNRVYRDIMDADNLPAGQQFDDIVLWRTQDLIFAENKQSCVVP